MNNHKAYRSSILHFKDDPRSHGDDSVVYYDDGVLIIENGHVTAAGDPSLLDNYPDIEVTHYPHHMIMPGFIDTHVHYPQIDIIASHGSQLLEWLEKYTYPTEEKFSDANIAQAAAEFFLQQLVKNGTTSALVFPTVHQESVAALFTAAQQNNMRLISGKVHSDKLKQNNLADTEHYIDETEALIKSWHGQDRLAYAVTPRFALTSSVEQLEQLAELRKKYPEIYVHTHLAENKAEIKQVAHAFPQAKHYLDVYDQYDLLGPSSIFAHGLYLSDAEWLRIAETQSVIAFCPSSNLFLGSGLFPLQTALSFGARVSIGSDVGAGTSLSMLANLADAYKVCQLQQMDFSPLYAFYLATLGNARGLNMDSHVGNFETGKEADFIVLDKQATPLLERRMSQVDDLASALFLWQMLGDDRAVTATYVMGKAVTPST